MDKETKNMLIIFTAGAAVYFAIIQPLLQKLGIQQTEQEKEQERQNKAVQEQFITDTLKRQKPSREPGQFKLFADQIHEFLKYSAISDKKEQAFRILFTFIHRDADIALLSRYFGERQEYNFGLPVGGKKNLSQFVVSNLSRNDINRINQAYARSKMKFRF